MVLYIFKLSHYNIFEKEKYDKILILKMNFIMDLETLPRDYSPKEVIEILNKYKDRIIAVEETVTVK